jgi:hypothetical protein
MEDFSGAMRLREQADYGLVYSEDSASLLPFTVTRPRYHSRKVN